MYKILSCSCKHEFQDEKYGRGNRVCNEVNGKDTKESGNMWFRCTICATIHTARKGEDNP